MPKILLTMFHFLGKLLIFLGLVLIIIGIIVLYIPQVPFLGKLPGDIYIKKDNFVFYAPLTTSFLISILISLILYIISKFLK